MVRYPLLRTRISTAVAGALLMLAVLFHAATASAHIVTETPWHPLAAAYRTAMFLGDLRPVPWSKIRTAYRDPNPAAYGLKSAYDKLAELDPELARNTADEIRRAISMEDRAALYAAATRSLSTAIRAHLSNASAALENPTSANAELTAARDIYRAVADFVRQADPEAFRKLGRAWLTLTTSAGSAGVVGKVVTASDRQRFDAARTEIENYLKANYEAGEFSLRKKLTPLPETVVASGTQPEITPWLPPGSKLNDQDPLPLLILRFEQRGIDEKDLPLVAYGDMLFDSPEIFGDPAKSLGVACSTCHNRSDINQSLFIPGISHQAGAIDVDGEFFNARFNDLSDDGLDIPSLRGLRFTGPYGRDGRFASLREFTRNVIINEFAGEEPTPFMLDALVAYMFEFDFLPNAKVTGDGKLTDKASDAARRGEKIFNTPFAEMQGKSCASCHIPSAKFLDRRAHDIGSQTGNYAKSLSNAFDTPTLLGARFTAPYFHDGSLPTLASVVEWFNLRYGLGLAKDARADLTAYLEAIGDADEPYEIYEDRHTPFRLAFEELTTFASTLDMLLPARDAFHAKLMIDTVASDLSLDAAGMTNTPAKPMVYELAGILVQVGEAIDSDDWTLAETRWARFKALQEKYDATMY